MPCRHSTMGLANDESRRRSLRHHGAVRRSWQPPGNHSGEKSTTSTWTGAESGDAAGTTDVIEGGAPSWRRRRPRRLPRLRWPVAVVAALALAAGGAAVVWSARSANDVPGLAALRAPPPASSGLLGWAPRGPLAGDEAFVRKTLQILGASGFEDRPRTRLHLLYAVDSIVLLEGKDRSDHPALAQVADGHVLVNRLPQQEPLALTLPVGAGLRFLVPPAATGAPGPAVVWVEDASVEPSGGFRPLPTDATGLTDEFAPARDDARFFVLEPRATGAGTTSEGRLEADGEVVPGSLTPAVPAIRLSPSPWAAGEQDAQPPFRQWLADAELLGAALPGGRTRVASLTGSSGFTPGPPRGDGKVYSGALYAVTDAAGQDYVGYVLRFGDEPLCHRLTPVRGHFADLLVVGDRCELPGESVAAVLQVITRPDVRHGAVELSGLSGQPPQRVPITGGASSGLVDFLGPAYPTVTLSATTGSESATYVVPSP